MMKFTLVCLSLLAVSLQGREIPSLDFPIPCFEVDRPANEVMEALGFEIQPNGGISATTVFAHVYNTRDWRQVWGQVKRPADTSGGLLPSTTRLRPFVTELAFYDVKPHWLKRGTCTVRLTMDFTGWKETLWAEGRERFRTTGQLEARILDLIRNQVEAKGLLPGK
jgi:hypothetical protein